MKERTVAIAEVVDGVNDKVRVEHNIKNFKAFVKHYANQFSEWDRNRLEKICRKRSLVVSVTYVTDQDECKVPPTASDSTIRMSFALDAQGNLKVGGSGTYDTILNNGVAGSHKGRVPNGCALIIVDTDEGYLKFAHVHVFSNQTSETTADAALIADTNLEGNIMAKKTADKKMADKKTEDKKVEVPYSGHGDVPGKEEESRKVDALLAEAASNASKLKGDAAVAKQVEEVQSDINDMTESWEEYVSVDGEDHVRETFKALVHKGKSLGIADLPIMYPNSTDYIFKRDEPKKVTPGSAKNAPVPDDIKYAIKNILARVKYMDYMDTAYTELNADPDLLPSWAVTSGGVTVMKGGGKFLIKVKDKQTAAAQTIEAVAETLRTVLKRVNGVGA